VREKTGDLNTKETKGNTTNLIQQLAEATEHVRGRTRDLNRKGEGREYTAKPGKISHHGFH
jgi:hypothetical protein